VPFQNRRHGVFLLYGSGKEKSYSIDLMQPFLIFSLLNKEAGIHTISQRKKGT